MQSYDPRNKNLSPVCDNTLVVLVRSEEPSLVKLESTLPESMVPNTGKIVVEGNAMELTIYLGLATRAHRDIAAIGKGFWESQQAQNPQLQYREDDPRGGGFFRFQNGQFTIYGASETFGPITASIDLLVLEKLNQIFQDRNTKG
jgi:hypothetical protein